MVENGRRQLNSIPESPEVPISSDLDWALQSSQASLSTVLEILVNEYYASMYNLAYSLLEDASKSKAVVNEVLLSVLTHKDRFRWEFGVKPQLYKLIYKECNRYSSLTRNYLESHPKRVGRNQESSELELHSNENTILWRYVDNLTQNERLALIIFYLHGLDIPEIAEVLQIKDEQVNYLLLAAKNRLYEDVGNEDSTKKTAETQIVQSLNARWPRRDFGETELHENVDAVLKRLEKKSERTRLYKAIQQVALGIGVMAFIWGIWWLTNISAKMSGPERKIIETVIVTKLVEIPKPTEVALATPSPDTSIKLLTETSTPQEILKRMKEGRHLWDTLWVNGFLIQYGPSGYVGPPRVTRDQVWVNQPQSSLVLTGSQKGAVNHAWYSVNGKVYEVNLETGEPLYYDFHGDQLPIYSSLESLIFPNELMIGENELKVLDSGKIAGQEVIIADWIGPNGKLNYRLWIDVYTGIVMRLHQFADDPDTVTYEILITSIKVNKDFQDNALSRQNLALDFIQDDIMEDVPLVKQTYPFSPTDEPLGQRTPYPKLYPSESFDPSKTELKFNWSEPPSDARLQPFMVRNRPADDSGETIPVDVFADGYYLGQVELNPWSITCDRSPDGRLLAFVTNIGEEGSSRPTMGWIDISDLAEIHFPPLDILPGWEIAFSPDSQNIAFQGCTEQECGIYILNVNSLEVEQISLGNGKYITWSRDGDYLAWIEAESNPVESGVQIVNIKADDALYFNNDLLEQDAFFDDIKLETFGVEFKEQEFGLTACSSPR